MMGMGLGKVPEHSFRVLRQKSLRDPDRGCPAMTSITEAAADTTEMAAGTAELPAGTTEVGSLLLTGRSPVAHSLLDTLLASSSADSLL
jgi:hypothetical protein